MPTGKAMRTLLVSSLELRHVNWCCFVCFLKHTMYANTMYAIHHGDLLLLCLAITVWSGLALCLPMTSADNF